MSLHHLLPPGCFVDTKHAYAFLLVNRHGHLHPLVALSLPKCQSRKSLRQTIGWPTVPVPLPNGPCIRFNHHASGQSRYSTFYRSFHPHADMYATTETEFTTSGTADILVYRYIPLWGCPLTPFFRQRPAILR